MRWRKYLPWLAVLVLILFAAKAFWPKGWVYQEEPLQRVQFLRQDTLRAEIRFPNMVFSGPRQAATINSRVNELHTAKTAAYAERINQLLDDAEFNGSLPEDPNRLYCYVDAYFSVYGIGKEYLSLLQGDYEHISDAPHPMTSLHAYVLDIASGQVVPLEDIWGGDARERAADAIYAQIESEGRLEDYYPNLRQNLLDNLAEDDWYMDDTTLYFIYNPYEIAAYAAGILVFELPLE